jgi:protein-tyrosine phosphatase
LTYDASKHFDAAYAFIEEGRSSDGAVLVHCAAGASRSATIVIAYLMRKRNWSFEAAFACVRKIRLLVNPNVNFVQQLVDFEDTLSIKEGNTLFRLPDDLRGRQSMDHLMKLHAECNDKESASRKAML